MRARSSVELTFGALAPVEVEIEAGEDGFDANVAEEKALEGVRGCCVVNERAGTRTAAARDAAYVST